MDLAQNESGNHVSKPEAKDRTHCWSICRAPVPGTTTAKGKQRDSVASPF